MALRTAFTDLLSLQHPIALAPPSALPSSTNGGAGKASLRPTPAPGRLIARPWRTAICHRTRCGPARRSTSSRRHPRRPISSARLLPRPM